MLKYSFQIISFDICNKDENVLFIIFFYKFIYFLKIYILYFCRDVSSYIVIQEKILPTGIEATTTRVCRVKYSKELTISTCSGNEKEYRHTIPFTSAKEMADKLESIAQTNDKNITYVDICMPIPFQQVHVHFYTC